MTETPLPQPQLEPTGITSAQYEAYTLQKLELWNGFYNYGGQDLKGFHLAVLTNMGLTDAIRNVPFALWLEAIEAVISHNPKLNFDTEKGEAMLNRLSRALEDLKVVAEYLEESS
jgi:hypothetical protein